MKKIILVLLSLFFGFSLFSQDEKFYSNGELVELLNEEVQKEINLVRKNPKRYQDIMESAGRLDPKRYETSADGEWFIQEKSEYFISRATTHEGISAYREANRFLSKQEKLKPYKFNYGLSLEAKKQCIYISKIGILTHARPNGEGLDYVKKLKGDGLKLVGEVLAQLNNRITPGDYEKVELQRKISDIAQEIVLGWIVDDGIKDRGHRKGLFHEMHNYFGAYCLIDESGTVICAVEFSTLPL